MTKSEQSQPRTFRSLRDLRAAYEDGSLHRDWEVKIDKGRKYLYAPESQEHQALPIDSQTIAQKDGDPLLVRVFEDRQYQHPNDLALEMLTMLDIPADIV